MRPKVILQLYPMLPADGEEGRKRARPVGRDADLYQRVLFEWLDIIKAADEMGVWGASTIEHHLHSEGYEVGPNPGVLNAWWAGQVKNLHVGALGYVMATQDPIRVAEETAILDHITRGKYFVGFARGYQSRWTNILGQFSNTVATVSDGSADDLKNRDIFEERVAMVLRCWEEDSVVLDGNYYQAPYPARHRRAEATRRCASPAKRAQPAKSTPTAMCGVISVVPPTYQKRASADLRRHLAAATTPCAIAAATVSSRPTSRSSTPSASRHRSMSTRPQSSASALRSGSGRTSYAGRTSRSNSAECDRMIRDYDIDIYKNLLRSVLPAVPERPQHGFCEEHQGVRYFHRRDPRPGARRVAAPLRRGAVRIHHVDLPLRTAAEGIRAA